MKSALALILALLMLLGMLPLSAFTAEAADTNEVTGQDSATHTCDCAGSYVAAVTYPTGVSKGYTEYTCSACGKSYRTPWLDKTAYEGMTIACVGDSITAAYGVTKDETDYVTVLAEQLGMDYIRLGVSGTTLCTDGSRTCNISKLTENNLRSADIVTIAMGINDFCAAGTGYYELGDIRSTDTSTIYGAVRMWCERIEALRKTDTLKNTQFYFLTPVICSWNNSVTNSRNWDQSKTNIHGYTLRDLCNAIIEVAALYDVAVIDLNLLSGMYYVDAEDNNTAVFGGDGVHPGAKGHEMMAAALANALLQNQLRDDHTHTFGSWITTAWPSCIAGKQQRVCAVCSAVESSILEADTSHHHCAEITAPTCTEQGYTTYTCSLCGDSYVDDYVDATGHTYENGLCTVCGSAKPATTISILGDSISTYKDWSNGAAAQTTNSTIGSGAIYYPRSNFEVTAESTWWYQTAEELGLEILVNNSWSGSCLLNTRSGTVGAYVDRCVQLHDNTGDDAGRKPDIIAIFLGTNDYYTYPDTLGTYEAIDFDALIQESEGTFQYAQPVTSLEAYAITLHRISLAYPDAQVYCFTLLPRVSSTNQPTAFNEDICQLAEKFGAYTVDLYHCGIQSESTAFYKMMGDSLHPDNPGMDAITNAFVSELLKNSDLTTYDVSFALEGTVAMEGTSRTVISGNSFETVLAPLDASLPLEVTVTMGGTDITDSCWADSSVSIPSVTADVVITAKPGQREPLNFRWETQADILTSVTSGGNTANSLTMTHGSITDGVFAKTRFTMSQGISLRHDLPWRVEWKSSGTWTDTTDGALLFAQANSSATADTCYFYRRHKNDFFAFGSYTGGKYHNYGVSFAGTGIDTTAEHVFLLENRIASDGSNMVWLCVDGKDVGPLNHHYIGGTDQKETVDWVSGKDFTFSYLGTNPHTIGGCSLEYIQVWENYHTHAYQAEITAPTCTQQGYTTYTCECGESYIGDYVNAVGHSFKNGICSQCGSLASPYIQQLPEDIIGCSNLYDILTPVKGYYTATQYDTGNGAVLSVVIPVEPGDRIAASSFGPVSENMGSVNGIRVTYLLDGKIVKSLSANSVYTAYTQAGYLTVPEGVNMVSVPWWVPSDSNWLTLTQVSKDFAVHSPKAAPALPPTCTEKGYTAGEICEVCSASLGSREEIPATGHAYSGNTCTVCGTVNLLAILDGKYVSVLGDSISTFNGYSNDATVNTTIGGNGPRYSAGTADTKPGSYCLLESVHDTWWMHFAGRSGMKLLVNNSWAGSQVFGGQTSDGRQIPPAYLERCVNLHDNTLDNNPGNAPVNPDVIFVYLGINDYNFNRSNVGSGTVDYAGLINSDGTYVTPTTFGEAYGILLHKMQKAYPNAQIFAMTLLPENLYSVDMTAWEQHNAYIRAAAEFYNVPVVDLAESCAITWENHSGYMIDKIHPTTAGMKLISDCIEAELIAYYKENPPHVHTPVTDPAVDAACTETGLTEGSHCETCGEVLVAQEEVPALGHDYADGICTLCGTRQTSTFQILDTRCNRTETFTYEVGMTWIEWLNSEYNTGMGSCIAIWVSAGPDILGMNPYMDIFSDGTPVDYEDVICEQDDLQLIRYR